MLENQFIQITNSTLALAATKEPVVLPNTVVNYAPDENTRVMIFIPGNVIEVALTKDDGEVLTLFSLSTQTDYRRFAITSLFYEGRALVTLDSAYYIRTTINGTSYKYSNPIIVPSDASEISHIRYYCDEDAFGFPFGNGIGIYGVSMYLPIRLHSPQNVQDDKTYVKANGAVVTLYANYYKEWEGETEYLSEATHDKIVAALSCDVVYINGKRVTKSDKYQVDWENYDLGCDGVTKIARATFKVREHITQRNSNF